ncbi:hypothetical protein Anapl_17445 [Anas platyrhynchos]|uniref:Uncharacterized protein n=1 Tax=Anas platyrhynchos TaxID=8839 RepID=R0LVV7_ANAPL|nr:hypothetical protein Anapl_17445 [Anas platyrhynchos]
MKAAVGTLCLLLVPRWQRAALSEREGAESPLPPSPACGKPSRPDLQERLQPSARSYEVSVSQEGGWHFHCARWGCVAMCSRFHSLSSSTQRRSLSLFQSDPSHPSPPSREIRLRCPRQPSENHTSHHNTQGCIPQNHSAEGLQPYGGCDVRGGEVLAPSVEGPRSQTPPVGKRGCAGSLAPWIERGYCSRSPKHRCEPRPNLRDAKKGAGASGPAPMGHPRGQLWLLQITPAPPRIPPAPQIAPAPPRIAPLCAFRAPQQRWHRVVSPVQGAVLAAGRGHSASLFWLYQPGLNHSSFKERMPPAFYATDCQLCSSNLGVANAAFGTKSRCQNIHQRIQQSGNGWDNMDLRKICVHTTSAQDGSN